MKLPHEPVLPDGQYLSDREQRNWVHYWVDGPADDGERFFATPQAAVRFAQEFRVDSILDGILQGDESLPIIAAGFVFNVIGFCTATGDDVPLLEVWPDGVRPYTGNDPWT